MATKGFVSLEEAAVAAKHYEHKQLAKRARNERILRRLSPLGRAVFTQSRPVARGMNISWVIFLVGLSFGAIWLVNKALETSQVPPFGTGITVMLFAMIPLAVYHLFTGGRLIEALFAVGLTFGLMVLGPQFAPTFFPEQFSMFVTGEPLKLAILSLI